MIKSFNNLKLLNKLKKLNIGWVSLVCSFSRWIVNRRCLKIKENQKSISLWMMQFVLLVVIRELSEVR